MELGAVASIRIKDPERFPTLITPDFTFAWAVLAELIWTRTLLA